MSNRSLVELNHDYCPRSGDKDLLEFVRGLRTYMRSGDKGYLPNGVVLKHRRHHSEPCPVDNNLLLAYQQLLQETLAFLLAEPSPRRDALVIKIIARLREDGAR